MKDKASIRCFLLCCTFGVLLFNISLCAQDSSLIGQPVRIVRSYDPNLPDWFRHTSDPILIQDPISRMPQNYRSDSMVMKLPPSKERLFEFKSLSEASVQDLASSRLFLSLGGNPGSHYNFTSSIFGPFEVWGQQVLGFGSIAGNFGRPNGNSISDSVRNLLVWNPQFFLNCKPKRSNWDLELDGGLRSTGTRGGSDTKNFDYQFNNFRFSPRATYKFNSSNSVGLTQDIVMEGFFTHFVASGGGMDRLEQSASEWSGNVHYEASYSGESHDIGIKLGLNRGRLTSHELDSINGRRGAIFIKPHWGGVFGNYRFKVAMDVVRQVEYGNVDDKDINWLFLPNLNFQFRPVHSKMISGRDAFLLELGLGSRLYQPSFYHWSSLYPTLSGWDNYRASVQKAEFFVRVEHGGKGKPVQWHHRLGIGMWNNARFFGIDSSRVLGVSAFTIPEATQLILETKMNWMAGESTVMSLTCGLQGLVGQRSWLGMPGLQPGFWAGIQYERLLFRGWKLDAHSVVYAISNKRSSGTPLKADAPRVLQFPLNLDLRMSKPISRHADLALAFRQREASLWMLWAEDLWWGKFFNLELRWKI